MKDLMAVANERLYKMDLIGIQYGNIIKFRVNNRFTRTFGMCRKRGDNYIIEVAEWLVDDEMPDESLENTIIHEILHSCKGCMNHGREWQRLANKVNREYGYKIQTYVSEEESAAKADIRGEYIKPTNHIVKCRECGYEWKYARMSKCCKNPERYHCNCGGKLYLVF